jgi:mitotic spindle assembly checkpoint protein MAD1
VPFPGSASRTRTNFTLPVHAAPSPSRNARDASTFSRESSKENLAPPDAEEYESQRQKIEELKAEVGTLRYKLGSLERETELVKVQAEEEAREAQRKADEEFRLKQVAEGELARVKRVEAAARKEAEDARDRLEGEKRELESKGRDLVEELRLANERAEELESEKEEASRAAERKQLDLQAQLSGLQRRLQELEEATSEKDAQVQSTQDNLVKKDETIATLEAEVLRLKAQTGDADTMAVIRRELSDQVNHIRTLETTSRTQLAELKQLRQKHRAVEVVEEEKRSLQRKVDAADAVRKELAEERHQRQRLEDERRAWTAYLENESAVKDEQFDSPEALARALVKERYNAAALTEKLGALEPEIAGRDAIIKSLEEEKAALGSQLERSRTSAAPANADKARQRADRLRQLANKEVENLRQQLKAFDAEDMTFHSESFDQAKAQQIEELQAQVDTYKQEVEKLHAELTSLESSATSPTQPAQLAGSRRTFTEANGDDSSSQQHEHLGQLTRKNRSLQDELSTLQTQHRLLQKELAVTSDQLKAAKEQSRVRILSLRSNPTSDFEAIKTSTLSALRTENAELLATLQRQPTSFPTIPHSQLAAAQREVETARLATASAEKSARRLKEVWSAKSAEFKEAIFSTLGWTVTFIPNGKMRVESVYYPSKTDEHENSIVFDGEKGTMKVAGGKESPFAEKIGDLIKFWVRQRGCIPGFLAAMTLEFIEEQREVTGVIQM